MRQQTQQAKDKIRAYHIGRKLSDETKNKIKEKRKLQESPFLNKKHSDNTKTKMRLAKLGKKMSESVREDKKKFWKEFRENPNNTEKIKQSHIKTSISLKGKGAPWNRGENSHLWKGGLTLLKHSLRKCFKYVQWRLGVYERDNFTCQSCGDNNGGNLEAHHIKSFSNILDDNNVCTYEEGLGCKELWDTDNGITLCKNCHEKTDNFGRRDYKLRRP